VVKVKPSAAPKSPLETAFESHLEKSPSRSKSIPFNLDAFKARMSGKRKAEESSVRLSISPNSHVISGGILSNIDLQKGKVVNNRLPKKEALSVPISRKETKFHMKETSSKPKKCPKCASHPDGGHVHIDDELTITRLKRQLNQKNMEVSQKDRAIQALQDKEASRYNELDSAYQRIMELEERLKSLSQENNQLRHTSGVPAAFQTDIGDSSVEFSRAIDSDLYSDLISE